MVWLIPQASHLGTHTSVLLEGLGSRPGKERRRAPIGWQLDALQMWAREGSSSSRCGKLREPGALFLPPPVSELGLVSEFGGWGGEEAAGTGEGGCRNLQDFPSCPSSKVCSGF